jgi:hypothetical protein
MISKWNLRYAFVCPLQIALYFLGSSDAVCKICLCSSETALCKRLQLHQLSCFGIELAGAAVLVSCQLKTLDEV